MKLSPKRAKFCPGCAAKNLKLSKAPQLIINTEKNNDTKIVTVLKNNKKIKGGLF